MPFTGEDYESIREFFGYNLSDLDYIKRGCDALERFTSDTSKNVSGVDYVVKVQDLLDTVSTLEATIESTFAARMTGVTRYAIQQGEDVSNTKESFGGQADDQARLDNAQRELELILYDYNLRFQQSYTIKS